MTAAVARHDGATDGHGRFIGERNAVGIGENDGLREIKTLIAKARDGGCNGYTVVKMHLTLEVNIDMHNHDGEIVGIEVKACLAEEVLFAEVKKLEIDGIIEMPHHIYIIETQL